MAESNWREIYNKKYPWLTSYYRAKNRCNSKIDIRYKNYGGRGIKFLLTKEDVKSVWLRDKASKMNKPSIDRINNNGHYEPKNIRFVELGENSRNRRDIKLGIVKAIEIRKLHKAGHSFASLGRKFNVSASTAGCAVTGKTWAIKTRTHKGESR